MDAGEAPRCEAILRSLPEWFGIDAAIVGYVDDIRRLPTWIADVDGEDAGFVTVATHNESTAEIQVMAVRQSVHRRGVGRALLAAAETHARTAGHRMLEVKTLGPSRDNEPYARTRAFYAAMGFLPLEESASIWGERNPCLVMVKWLG